jgi:hypothetical protein
MRLFALTLLLPSAVALLHPREFYETKFVDWMNSFNKDYGSGGEFVHRSVGPHEVQLVWALD